MTTPDYYRTLGVPLNATVEQITASYRALAKTHHPDRGGDPQAFQAAKEAYGVLSDPTARAAYDTSRAPAPQIPLTPAPHQAAGYPSAPITAPYRPTPAYAPVAPPPSADLRATARRLRAIQYVIAASIGALWYITRVTGAAAAFFGHTATAALPHPARIAAGSHFHPIPFALIIAAALILELIAGIALRVNLTRPALLRWALAPTLATGFLIGEYLLTTTGLVDWAVATGIFTVVSLGLTFAKAGVAWRHLP